MPNTLQRASAARPSEASELNAASGTADLEKLREGGRMQNKQKTQQGAPWRETKN